MKRLFWLGVIIFIAVIANIVFTIFYNTPDRRAKRQEKQTIKAFEYVGQEKAK